MDVIPLVFVGTGIMGIGFSIYSVLCRINNTLGCIARILEDDDD